MTTEHIEKLRNAGNGDTISVTLGYGAGSVIVSGNIESIDLWGSDYYFEVVFVGEDSELTFQTDNIVSVTVERTLPTEVGSSIRVTRVRDADTGTERSVDSLAFRTDMPDAPWVTATIISSEARYSLSDDEIVRWEHV